MLLVLITVILLNVAWRVAEFQGPIPDAVYGVSNDIYVGFLYTIISLYCVKNSDIPWSITQNN